MGTEMDTGWGRGCHRATKCLPLCPPVSPLCPRPAEKRLRSLGLLHASPKDQPFFRLSPPPGPVEDDHVPFLQRGNVPVSPRCPQIPTKLHVPSPCPRPPHRVPNVSPQASPCCISSPCPSPGSGTPPRTMRPTSTCPPWRTSARSSPPSWPSSCSSEPPRHPRRGIGAAPGRAGSPPELNPRCLAACPVLSPTPGDTHGDTVRIKLTGWQDRRGGNPAGKGNRGLLDPIFSWGGSSQTSESPIRTPKCCWMLHRGGPPRFNSVNRPLVFYFRASPGCCRPTEEQSVT